MSNIKYTKENLDFLIKNYKNGSIEEIAKKINTTIPKIWKKAYRLGLKRQVGFDYSRINIDFKCPEFLYILGFIWADGHVNKQCNTVSFSMHIQKRDGDILLNYFNKIGDFRTRIIQKPNRQPIVEFLGRNDEFCKLLYDNDYIKKSFIEPTKILSKIPEELKYYWWRGFFDGDGSVGFTERTLYKWLDISGRFDYKWEESIKLFNKLNLKYIIKKSISKNGSNSRIMTCSYNDILGFFNYIYPNYIFDNIGLYRKFEKFIQIKNNHKKCYEKTCFNIFYKNKLFYGSHKEIKNQTNLSTTHIYRLRNEFKNRLIQ